VAILAIIVAMYFFVGYVSGDKRNVPDLTKMTLVEAKAKLSEVKMTLDEDDIGEMYSDEVEEGRIIEQIPAPGTSVKGAKKIKVTLSLGSANLEVPDVTNMLLADALALLEKDGFTKIKEEKSTDDRVAEGRIISQSPVARQQVSKNTQITLVVSTGQSIVLPDFTGDHYTDAEKTLRQMGFDNIVVSARMSNDMPMGAVIYTFPAANTKVTKETTITIYYSNTGPVP
jgi:serine/threonine-protein kinase